MASVITIAGEKLFAAKAQANEQLDIDTFIFANVPAQDPAAPINRDEGLPTDHVVHQQIVQQVGRINENVVVYSTVLDSVTGPFEFNWVGLYSSINDTLVAINHIPSTVKTVNEPGSAGNTLNRNFGIEYSGIADLTDITVAPETWQLDFTARLSGIDKLTQQLAVDMNGKDWFIEDGFKVYPRGTVNTFSVSPGVGYVAGLRIQIKEEHILTLNSYPQYIYVDAQFTGTSSSEWKSQVDFTVTDTEMNDYIDATGKQHYVYKLAVVNAADFVTDLRNTDGLSQKIKKHLESKSPHDNEYTKQFDKTVDMVSSLDLVPEQKVRTYFYNAKIVQDWIIKEVIPNGEYGIELDNGLFAIEVSNEKYFESFGAYGTGDIFDDSAFIFAQSYKGVTKGIGNYRVKGNFLISNGSTWEGNWSTIILDSMSPLGKVGDSGNIGNFIVDGLNKDHTEWPFRIATPSSGAKIGKMIWKDFHGKTAYQTYVVSVPLYGATNFEVDDQQFYNIKNDDNGAVIGKGFVGGLYLYGLDADAVMAKSKGYIGNIFGDKILTVDAGLGVVQDADLVRIYAESHVSGPVKIKVGNVTGVDIGKRLVKASSCDGMTFGDISSKVSDGALTLHSVVEVLSTGNNFKFGDITSEGDATRVVWFKGNGNQCKDIYDNSGAIAMLFGEESNQAVSCGCGKIIGRGINGVPRGWAVQLSNADNCETGSINTVGYALRTQEHNVGKNKIGDIVTSGKIVALHGDTSIGKIKLTVSGQVAGSHMQLGEKFKLSETSIETDGRVTVSIAGDNIDGDIGVMKINRISALNGSEDNHSIFTTSSAVKGRLRGSLEVNVHNSVDGSPSGSAGKSLVYIKNLTLDMDKVLANITATIRGATGYALNIENCDGAINRAVSMGGMIGVTSRISGNICVTKAEQLIESANLALSEGTTVFYAEKRTSNEITGSSNVITILDTTRNAAA